MTTLRDIAHEAGVSIETVSRALTGKYAQTGPKGRARVAEISAIAERLGYRAHAGARALRTGRGGQVGVVVANASLYGHPVVLSTLAGINEGLESAGLTMTLCRLREPLASQVLSAPALASRLLDALIVVDPLPAATIAALAALVPCCVEVNTGRWAPTLHVARDEAGGAKAMGRALQQRGYRRAGWLGGSPGELLLRERFRGFTAGFGRAAQPVDLPQAPLPATEVLIAPDVPTALACLTHLANSGLRPGREVSLVCLDEVNGMESTWPGLARIASHRIRLGAAAAGLVDRHRHGGDLSSLRIPAELIPGDTAPGPGH